MQLFPRTQRTRSVAAHPILSGRFQIEPLEPRIVFAVIPIAGEIANGSSWIDGNIYQITADARVAAGSLLTIEAGAIIKFNDFVGIDLLIEGTVNANGTAAKPILFTSLRDDTGLDGVLGTADDNDTNLNGPTNAGAGEWNQIHVATGGRANLTNVDIRSAGDVFGGVVASLFVNGGNVSLTNSTIQKSEQAGVRIVGADPTLTGNTFRDNFGAAVSMDLASNPAISGVTLTNNAVNGLLVDAGTISGARVWDDIDIVYRLSGDITIAQGATLTIAPGQEIKARDFLSDELIVNGTLLARGTPAQPILFASFRDDRGFDNLLNTADDRDTNNNGATSAGAGEWNGLVFNASSTGNILENVEVRSGGDFAVAAAIIVNGAPLTFSSSIVRDSETHGIRINGSNPILSNNAFRGNFGAAVSMDLTSNPAISGVTVTGNAINGLLVDAGTITGAGVWDDSDIVYRLNGDVTIAQGATLTIAPGQEIKARDFAGDDIIVNGTLLARGTAAQPILFASFRDDRGFDNLLNTADDHDTNNNGATSAGAGEWNGLVFNASSTGNILENVEVRSAGDFAVPAAIIINSAPLTFSSSIVRDSETHGVRINASNPTLTNNIYRGNFGGAISMDLASDPVIAGVTASNNAVNGLIVDSGSITGSRRWDDPDIVYRLNGDVTVAQGATLTIAPGQIIKARDFAGDEIVINGTLVADGTPAQKILFASFRDDRGFDNLLNTADDSDTNNNGATAAGAGEWNGLVFNAGSSGNVLNNVEVRSAGDFGVAGAIIVDGAPLALSNSTIGDSETFGIRIVGANPVLTNNRITGSFGGAISMDLSSNPAIAGITLTSNAVNGVAVDAGTISGSQVWDDAEIVYRLSGDVTIATGATLTIAAGQIIKARDFAGDEIIVNGTLLAAGTAPRPIVFASFRDDSSGGDTNNNGVSSAGAGEWNGLVFNTGSSGSILNHVDVRSAGDFGVAGAILVSGGSATVTNSVVTLSETNALAGRNGGVLMASGNVIRDNLDAAIRAETGAQISAFNNTIDGNLRGLSAAGSGTLVTLTNNLITNHVRSGILNAGATINASFNLLFNPTASGGEYEGLPSQTGQNGNISANPQYFNRASKQFQLRAGSPAIDSATSEGAPATDFADSPRFDDPNVLNLGSGAQVFFDRGAYERQEVSVSDVDLRGVSVSGPSTGLQGQNITVNWTVENLGPRALLGSWFDAIYLSDDAVFTPDDLFLGDAQHTGDLPAGASYAGSKQVTLPGVLPDDYYFIVRANSRGEVFEGIALLNNAVASSQTIAMDLPVLTLGAPLTGQLPQTGSVLFYKINAPNGADLSVNLDGPGGATNELFLSFGELPSRQSFDERGNRPNSADQSISVADTQSGQYYAMVFGANLTAPETFTISASLAGFGITEVSPVRGSNTGEVTLTIRGSQFDANSQPRLIDSANQTLTPTRVIFSDSGQISATFNLAGRPTGAADVQVVNSGNVVTTLPDAVNIVSGKQGQLVTNLIAPSRVRLGRDFTLFIELKNTGDTDLLAPVLELEGLGFSTLSFRADMAQSASALTLLGANDTAPAGVLAPGAEVRIPIYGRATGNGDESFTLRVANYPGTPIDYAAIEALVRPANIPDAEWDPLYAETQAQIGTQWSGYVQRLAENATLLPASKGSPFSLEDVFSLEIDRARASLNTSVSGMLFLGDNTRPLADVEVFLVDRLTGEGVTTSTLNDGTFLLPEVEPGTFRISFGGFVSATPVDITVAAADVNGVSVVVEPGGVIRGGVLLGAGGAPLRDVPVIAMNTQGDLFTSQTGADGTFQLDSLPAGDYTVSAGGGALSRAEVSVIGLARGEQEAHVNFALAPASTLQGTVTGPGGAISGALVSAIGADNQAFSATTGANGEFTINGLPGQSYTLVSFFGGLVSQEQANVNVASGTTVSGLALALAAAGGIRGTITAPGGAPVPFAPLVITTSDGREFFAQTESDGDYEVGDLPAGTFTVTPIDTAFMSVSSTAMVTSGAFTDLNLQLTPLGSVSGTVTNSTNSQPLRGVTVFVVDALGVHGSDVTDATGAYSVPNLDDGSYSIVVGNIGTPGVARFDVTLSDATPEASRNFTVAVAGVITGTVFGPGGSAPQAGAIVTLSQQGDAILRQPVNADGTYSIVVLSDGAYQVEATAVSLSYPVVSVSVSGGATLSANNFLPGVRALNGIVQNAANSQPISGASILIEKTSPTVASREVATVLSASNGAFDFGALADGAYRLTISAAGFGTVIENFTVAGGNPTPLTVGLGPEGSMSGTVRDSQTAALLANATLLLVSQANPSLSLTTVADASGVYRLEKVPPGTYDLIVLPGDTVHQSIARVVTVAAGENILDAQLPTANIQVSGQISGGGGPLRDALVFALDANGRYRASVFTDAAGNYLFTTLAPGNYSLVAAPDLFAAATPLNVSVASGQTVGNNNFTLTPAALSDPSDEEHPAPLVAAAPGGISGYITSLLRTPERLEREPTSANLSGRLDPVNCPEESRNASRLVRDIPRHFAEWQEATSEVRWSSAREFASIGLQLANTIGKFVLVVRAVAADAALAATSATFQTVFQLLPGYLTDLGNSYFRVKEAIAKPELDASKATEFGIEIADKSLSIVNGTLKAAREEAGKLLKGTGSFAPNPTRLEQLGRFVKGLDAIFTAYQTLTESLDAYNSLVAQVQRVELAHDAYSTAVANANAAIHFLDDCKKSESRSPEPIPPPMTTVVATSSPTQIRSSFDPNDKHGPAGFGAGGFIQPGVLSYEVEFENDPVFAQIAAQIVDVKDTLDLDLDLATFEFTSFGFSNRIFAVPAGLTHFETTIDLRPDGIDLLVPVVMDLNSATREVRVTFSTLDPLTMQAPEGFEGFLPVNNASHAGEGFFTYVVQPQSGLSTGSAITNQAQIVFDDNAPINTPTTLHTIDIDVPTSTVATLPANTNEPTFAVSWSGDDGAGSAIATYDLFVIDNGGPATLFLDDTTLTTTMFEGQRGHTYAFFTVARDNVGLVEAAPGAPDAAISVDQGQPISFDAKNPLTFTDANGDAVIVKIKGAGSGQAILRNGQNSGADLASLFLSATTSKTSVSISAGKTGATSLESVTVEGGLKALKLAAGVVLGAENGGVVEISGALGSFTTKEMFSGAFSAAGVGKFVAGGLDQVVLSIGAGATLATSKDLKKSGLGTLQIAADVTNTVLTALGNVGKVTIGGAFTDSMLVAGIDAGADRIPLTADDTYHRHASVQALTVKDAFLRSSVTAGIAPGADAAWGGPDDVLGAALSGFSKDGKLGKIVIGIASVVAGSGSPFETPATASHLNVIQAPALAGIQIGKTRERGFDTAIWLDANRNGTEETDEVLIRTVG